MNFEASREKAIDKLNNFVEKNLSDYARLRNFDLVLTKEITFRAYHLMLLMGFLMKLKLLKNHLLSFPFQKMKSLYKRFFGELIGKGGLS